MHAFSDTLGRTWSVALNFDVTVFRKTLAKLKSLETLAIETVTLRLENPEPRER